MLFSILSARSTLGGTQSFDVVIQGEKIFLKSCHGIVWQEVKIAKRKHASLRYQASFFKYWWLDCKRFLEILS